MNCEQRCRAIYLYVTLIILFVGVVFLAQSPGYFADLRTFLKTGLDLRRVTVFLYANLISLALSGPVFFWAHRIFFAKAKDVLSNLKSIQPLTGATDKVPKESNSIEALRDKLGLQFGGMIGRVEGVLYIYALMTSQFVGLLTGVIVLKALFGWIRVPEPKGDSQSIENSSFASSNGYDPTITEVIILYHGYIFGNLISVLLALTSTRTATFAFLCVGHYWKTS